MTSTEEGFPRGLCKKVLKEGQGKDSWDESPWDTGRVEKIDWGGEKGNHR